MRDGKGTFEYANGDKYVGDWKEDMQHGKGIYFFHTGDRYEGSYVQGERTGEGIYYHASGNKYVGNFKNGMQDGHGTLHGRTVLYMTDNGKTTSAMAMAFTNGTSATPTKVNGKIINSTVREL